MPSVLTYPGVYIEEVPSGVRSITGVSTSVTAFIGAARRGPVNRAVRIQSFADYERTFGGLDPASEMSYGVRQFFLNGGSDSWVVRLAKGAAAASRPLDAVGGAAGVLTVTARDEGTSGNAIQVWADPSPNPSVFGLTFIYTSADNPAASRVETFEALSMNSQDFRYAVDVVNAGSELVRLTRNVTPAALAALAAATSTSAPITDVADALIKMSDLIDGTHNQLRVSVNGLPPVTVTLAAPAPAGSAAAQLTAVCGQIEAAVIAAANGAPELSAFDCSVFQTTRIQMTSGKGGEQSSVRVLPGAVNDVTARLHLGAASGGTEADGTAPLVPAAAPAAGTLLGAVIANAALSTTGGPVDVSLNGAPWLPVTVAVPGSGTDDVKAAAAAASLQAAVRALKNDPAYKGFTATAGTGGSRRLTLSSGTRGAGSTVAIRNSGADTTGDMLGLNTGAAGTAGANLLLAGGVEQSFTNDEPAAYGLFIGSRAQRRGIYALDATDGFNLMCLPGVTDPGILADAVSYCVERRAFLIADSRRDSDQPAEMVADITGTAFPKSPNAAVYYPWLRIADPLAGGRLRTVAPSGTVAGVFARTDTNRGIWKAPAGTDAPMLGVQAVTYALTDAENGQLNPLGVNCLRVLPVYGAVPWGTRTLAGANAMASEWKYIPVRRLALYVEESLYRGTQWVVFEPNDEPLWGQIRLNVGAFMHGLFRQGAFQGRSPKEAYFVKCDAETTTQADINLGVVNVQVGFMPLKPAEFVVIRIQQMAGQIQS